MARKFSSRGALIIMVVVLTIYTWSLVFTARRTAVQYLQEHGLSVTENFTVTGLLLNLGNFTALTLATVGSIFTLLKPEAEVLLKPEAEKCPRYPLRLASFLSLLAFGYGIRLIASVKKGTGAEVLGNASCLFSAAYCVLLCTFQRYKELDRETSGYQVEAVGQVVVESRL